jgi:hypothetical protein
VERDGSVESSRAAIAEVKSLILAVVVVVVVVPLDAVEELECAVLFNCLVLTLGISDVKLPAAEEGSFCRGGEGSLEDEGDGEWSCWRLFLATGSCGRANALDIDVVVGVCLPRRWLKNSSVVFF